MKPWEKYQQSPAKPWEKYANTEALEQPQAPSQPDYKAEFDSLPWYERSLIGMGKGLNNAARGVGEAVGADLAPKDKAIEDSIGGFAGGAGELVGGILPTIPAAFVPGVNTAIGSSLLGAASGALLNEGDISTRAQNAGIGAAGGFIGTQVPHAIEIGRRALAPFGSQLTKERIAGDAVRAATNLSDPANARLFAEQLRQGRGLIPGSQPTAAEIGESGGLSSLQQWASAADKEAYVYRQMENAAARKAALSQIAGTPEDMAAAIAARDANAENLYKAAASQKLLADDGLSPLLQRPDFVEATNMAEIPAKKVSPYVYTKKPITSGSENIKLADGQIDTLGIGRSEPLYTKKPIVSGADEVPLISPITGKPLPNEVSIGDLHAAKLALDKMSSGSTASAYERMMQGRANSTRKDLVEQLMNRSPEYRAANEKYIAESRPINQMQIAQELEKRFQSALSDYGPMTRQTAESYAKALRDGDKLAANVTGYKGAKFNEIFDPEQLDTFNNIATELNRKTFADSAGNVGSNTFDKFNTDALLNTVGVPTWVSGLASVMPGVKGAMSGMRSAGNWLYGDANKEMRSILSQALLSPQSTADLIEKSITPTMFDDKLLPAAKKIAPLLLIGAGNTL